MRMNKTIFRMMGVTLLEVMLVLAIAAMIIVMSVRYYQSASTSSKINSGLTDLQGAMAAVDAFISAGGSMANVSCGGTSACSIAAYLPNGTGLPANAWGGTISTAGTSTNYTVTFTNVNDTDCGRFQQVATQNNTNITAGTATGGTCAFTIAP